MRRQGLLKESDAVLPIEELRKKYHVSTLKVKEEDDNGPEDGINSFSSGPNMIEEARYDLPGDQTMSASIPDEQNAQKTETNEYNFVITMEERKEFEDLQDVENTPVLDLIYHEQTAMGLPVVIATNRDQSKLDNHIPQTPSYFKHLKSLKPDHGMLI